MDERRLLSGNEAIARGSWESGVDFASAYPGTPSSEILPALAKLGIGHIEWSVNEKCALEAAVGASLAGARCLVTMKHVGLNVAADPFFTLAYMGVEGGLVIVTADDPAMHSSQNEQDNRHFARAAQVPCIEPANSQEALDFTRLAYKLSEEYDLPVLLRVTTRLCHSDAPAATGERQMPEKKCQPAMNAEKYVMVPAYARRRNAVRLETWQKLEEFAETTELNRVEMGDTHVGIVCSGVSYQYARDVMPDASFMKLGLTWPLPERKLREFADGVEEVVVLEESGPFLAGNLKALGIAVRDLPQSAVLGEMSPARVRAMLCGEEISEPQADPDLPPRPPVLCAGCPHRATFTVLRKLKCHVTGDIGCYTLGALPPLSSLHTCLCMGGSIGMAHGSNTVCGAKKSVAVIGDSTFIHSGITGLINLVYNGGKSVVVIMDNSTTAMTGGQEHPATGKTLTGKPAPQLSLEAICRATGVQKVLVADTSSVPDLEEKMKAALTYDGPAVVIARGPCVLVGRVRDRAYYIDAEQCIQCGMCLRLGCPAIGSRDGQPIIDAALCTGCGLCAQVCPKNCISQVSE